MVKDPSQLAEYPFTPKRLSIHGQTMTYLDEGTGPAVVCVHGNPSWSYLYRNIVAELSDHYRFIVPDHIGCGFSDKPQKYEYTLQTHIDNLETLLEHCGVEECVLIVHDWGGAIGMGWAGHHPGKVKGIVLLNTAAFRSDKIPFRIAICRWPLLGDLLVRGLNGFAGAALFMAVHGRMKPEVAKGFLAPYKNWTDRIAILRFVQDIPLAPEHPSYETLQAVETSLAKHQNKPVLICWGEKDFCFTHHFLNEWQKIYPDAEIHRFPRAGHYVLEDAGTHITTLIQGFLTKVLVQND
jgi:haloalkane dehalogenase